MDNLQVNLEEESLLPFFPRVINISSDSGDKFLVHLGDVTTLDDRFRTGDLRSNMMTAFVRAGSATLFPASTTGPEMDEVNDISGTRIERQLVDLMEEGQHNYESLSTSFIDTELQDSSMSQWKTRERAEGSTNSYGRLMAATLPTPRDDSQRVVSVNKSVATYPPSGQCK